MAPTTIVLIGRTGNGKSSSGNTILYEEDKEEPFVEQAEQRSQTVKNQSYPKRVRGRDIELIDTPGTQNKDMGVDYIAKEIQNVVKALDDGESIDCFLVTFKYSTDRLSLDDRNSLKFLERVFSKNHQRFFDHVIFLFTYGDDYMKSHRSKKGFSFIDEMKSDRLQMDESAVGPVLRKAKYRAVLFNNKGSNEEKAEMVENLLQLIDAMKAQEGYTPYTNTDLPPIPKIAYWWNPFTWHRWLFA